MKHNFDLKSIRLVLLDVDGVLTDGRIVKSGGKDLAMELEEKGYAEYTAEAA